MDDEDQNIGFQDPDEEMPSEMKDYGLAAFAHAAGFGPHPGTYQGPPRRKPGEPTETDLQRAHHEEANAPKMREAQMGLAPSEMEQQKVKQTQALGQQATTQGAVKAQQAQGAQTPVPAPAAPSGPAGTQTPYPAQAGPQPPPDVTALPPGQQQQGQQPPPAPTGPGQ